MDVRLIFLILLGSAALGSAYADNADPPGRAARLSDVEGSVSLEPAGLSQWTAATRNRPLTTGDRLWADTNSRAELDAGGAVMRLGSSTAFAFLNLDDTTAQMQLTAGTLIVRVRDMPANQVYEVDTPNVALSLQQPGEYRVEVSEAGDATVVKVSDGAVQAAGGGHTVAIGAQQQVTFTGTTTLAYDSATLAPPDDFDSWAAAREEQVEDSASSDYVASDVPGSQDLDNSGTWQDTADYGYAWTPSAVAVGWVPYRFGHWAWITPWGWTYIDDAPWGYAPFHYGRWAQCNNTWCWVPGPRGVPAVYAPAMVAWVGAPGATAPSAFGGNVGWFPLAPHEVYVPAYRVSASYVRNVNVSNTTGVTNTTITSIYQNNIPPAHYQNNRPAAVTAVAQNVFTAGQRVGANALHLSSAVLAGALVTATAPAIAPIRQSVLEPADGRRVARPPAAVLRRSVVAHAPPPPAPVSFDTQLAAIQANGGRPLARAELAKLQPATSAADVRVIAIAGPVVAASALPRRSGGAHTAGAAPMPPARQDEAPLSFAERERILENPVPLAPAPRANSAVVSAGHANAFVPPTFSAPAASAPEWRSDRPPSAQGYPTPAQQRPAGADDSTQRAATPLPVYHSPGNVPEGAARTESRAPPPASAPAPQPASHAPSPKSSRDPAAHSDRDSRERLVR
jgi:hypothetical protein